MKTAAFMASYRYDYHTNPDCDIVGLFKEDGFDGAEPDHYSFYIRKEDPIEASKRIRERMEETGIVCPCYTRGMTMVGMDRNWVIKELRDAVDTAQALNAPLLHFPVHLISEVKNLPLWDSNLDLFTGVCKEIAYYAGEKNITCVWENQGFLVNTPDRLGELLAKVDMPNTGINFDTGNALYGDADPYEFASKLGSYIKYVHIKDVISKPFSQLATMSEGWERTPLGNALRPTIIGHGVLDFEKIFTTLLLAGYDGFYSIEHEAREDDMRTSLKESLENMKIFYNRARASLIEKSMIKE